MPDIYSAPSATATATVTVAEWWLKDPAASNLNIRVRVADSAISLESQAPQGVFAPLGRANQLVVSDTPKGDTITLTLSFLSKADVDALAALRNGGRVLLLQSPFARQWYVAFGGDVASSLVYRKDTTEHRSVAVSFVETAAP